MKILAIETCFGKCSVCLQNGTNTSYQVEETKNTHRESLPKMTREILSQQGIGIKDIDAIVVNHGPGTFTGIRIGIAFAQGLAIPFQIPVYGISTMEALITAKQKDVTGVAVKAIGDFCYYQEFSREGKALSSPAYIPVSSIPQTPILITAGINNIGDTMTLDSMPNAKDLVARFSFIKPQIYSEPLYVREASIQVPDWKKQIK